MLGAKLNKDRFPRADLFFSLLLFSKFHLFTNFAADTEISKGREGGMGIYT